MYRGYNVGVVVPAYNEARVLGHVLDTIPDFVDAVVVVDDGSTDGSYAVAQKYRKRFVQFVLIKHPKNMGFGAALKSGYTNAVQTDADIVVLMGGDGQCDPADLPNLMDPIVEGSADIVNGDRFAGSGAFAKMPRDRFALNQLLTLLANIITGYRIRDAECGYTALSRRCVASIDWNEMTDGWGIGLERLIRFRAKSFRLVNVPVRAVYMRGRSRLRYLPFLLDYLLVCTKLMPIWVKFRRGNS